jgi:hypothetical protein
LSFLANVRAARAEARYNRRVFRVAFPNHPGGVT